ncbi:MAG: hypothetical protein ACKPFF_14215 [Planktothrix sp.]
MYYKGLIEAIQSAIHTLMTSEYSYYSSSKLGMTRDLAERILAEWIKTFDCEEYLTDATEGLLINVLITKNTIKCKLSP